MMPYRFHRIDIDLGLCLLHLPASEIQLLLLKNTAAPPPQEYSCSSSRIQLLLLKNTAAPPQEYSCSSSRIQRLLLKNTAAPLQEYSCSSSRISRLRDRGNILLPWQCTEVEFLEEIQTKILVFLLVIHSHLNSFVWDFLFFKHTPPFTVSVKEISPPHGLRNPYRNFKSDNSQDYAEKPSCDCKFMNSASVQCLVSGFPTSILTYLFALLVQTYFLEDHKNLWLCIRVETKMPFPIFPLNFFL